MEALSKELQFRKDESFLSGIYHSLSQSDQYLFDKSHNTQDIYSNDNNILLVDFNAQIVETCLDSLLYQHELENVNKGLSCNKNTENLGYMDFLSRNSPRSFFKINTYFNELSDL